MTLSDAIAIVLAQAEQRAENTEEAFGRVLPDTLDSELDAMAGADDSALESLLEVREVWRAFQVIRAAQASGKLTD